MGSTPSDDDWTCYAVFVFTGVRNATDRIIDLLSVGGEVHVDVGIFDTADTDNNGILYSSYVGQPLQKTVAFENNYDALLDKVLVSNITKGQAVKALSMLNAFVDAHIKYNTRDLLYCVYPKFLTDVFVNDISSPENVHSVFCSQLAILVMRELKHFDSVSGTLQCHPLALIASDINCRTISPARLNRIVSPFCAQVHLRKFTMGCLEFINQ